MTTLSTNIANYHVDRVPRVQRDYWEIDILGRDLSDLDCDGVVTIIRGRRRTTEAFWPGLRLDQESLLRFAVSLRNAVTIAKGFAADDDGSCQASFPNSHTLAICNGSDYVIETSESIDGFGKRSIGTTIFGLGQPLLPSAHFIDEELSLFCEDLDQVIASFAVQEQSGSSWTVPPTGIA